MITVLALVALTLLPLVLYLVIIGLSPTGYTPMSPEEEHDMLINHYGLTEDEAFKYMHGIPT